MIITLRDYQVRAIAESRALVMSGKRAPLLVSSTGTGKTAMGAAIARGHVDQGGTVLWLSHRAELIDQSARALTAAGCDVGIIAASRVDGERRHARVQVASVQTMLARGMNGVAPSMVVYDEARHYLAAEWSAVLGAYPDALRIGLDATPERQDGIGLGGLFDCIVVATTIARATAAGYLVPLEIIAPDRALESGELAATPLDAYLTHAAGQQAVVFAPHVRAAREYAAEFSAAGIPAGVITGDMIAASRVAVLAGYGAGALRVLCSVGTLVEGWDSPATGVAILARGCGSPGAYIQIVGRVLRPYPGKTSALLLDLRGVVHIHGRPDEDRVYSLEGRGIRRASEMGTERFCPVCKALMADNDTVCADCGRERPESEMPHVVSAPLKKYARDALKADSPERIVARLAKWLREAEDAGHKRGAALYRFKGAYMRWPTSTETKSAERMNAKGSGT